VFEWNKAYVRLDLCYDAVVVAGYSQEFNITFELLDLDENLYVKIYGLKLEVRNTVISNLSTPNVLLNETQQQYGFSMSLNFDDPAFQELAPGTTQAFSVKVTVTSIVRDASETDHQYEESEEVTVYVQSPDAPVFLELNAESEVVVGEVLPVEVNLTNAGLYPIKDVTARIFGEGITVEGPFFIRLNSSIAPLETVSFSFAVIFESMGTYTITVEVGYKNTANYNMTKSISKMVVVKGLSGIQLAANHTEGTIMVYGYLNPPRAYATIVLYYTKGQSQNWTYLATVETGYGGFFSYVWKPYSKGLYRFKAIWEGDESYSGTESEAAEVLLEKDPTFIEYAVSKARLSAGEELEINGYIEPPSIEGGVVSVMISENGKDWTPIALAEVTNGQFTAKVKLDSEGTYYLKLKWPGDEEHYGCESDIAVIEVVKGEAPWVFVYPTLGLVVIVALAAMVLVKVRRRG